MGNKKFIPKQGEMIRVREYRNHEWKEREFIAITSDNKYLCWAEGKTEALSWKYAEPISKEPKYYYQWEKLYDDRIATTDHLSDTFVEENEYKKDGWRKIESSKRLWEA